MLAFADIRSDYDGVITQRSKRAYPGNLVRADVEQGDPLLTVERTDKFRVIVLVPDLDVPLVAVGEDAVLEIESLPGQQFHGTVARKADREDPQTRLMAVEVDLDNATGKIKAGMFGRVTINLDKANLLAVPPSCLVSASRAVGGRAQAGAACVFVVRKGHARLIRVRVGTDNGVRVPILSSNLRPDDLVVLNPSRQLEDGQPVTTTLVEPEIPAGAVVEQ
jgi:RND family efflux transporter MFP subunit